MGSSGSTPTHTIAVKTGEKKGAETDGNVFATFSDVNGKTSAEVMLDAKWRNEFKNGQTDEFEHDLGDLGRVAHVHIRRDTTGADDAWFVETIVVKYKEQQSIFPIHRWISASSKYSVAEFDAFLPQFDPYPEQRKDGLSRKRINFKLTQHVAGLPKQVEVLPSDEAFAEGYQSDLNTLKKRLYMHTKWIDVTTPYFDELEDFEKVYTTYLLDKPYGMVNWKSDAEFGNQRLTGCNPFSLELCKQIPDYFVVTDDMVAPFLENQTLAEAMKKKKIYILDYSYQADIVCNGDKKLLTGAMGLFYSQKCGDLVPIAIQLIPGAGKPVYLPSDPEYVWLNAKLWFNVGDSAHHQSWSHLGSTHLTMEGFAVVSHRQLSISHPIFRLLAPHFLYLLAINASSLTVLVAEGGFVDQTMRIGRNGLFNVLRHAKESFDVKETGNIIKGFKNRGVDDVNALPNYHYRDDATLLWNTINKYIRAVVDGFYDTPEKLSGDEEIQAWAAELADGEDGVGVKGMPSSISSNEELAEILTYIIFTCSCQHAAANFGQYDEYAFPPNYPSMLRGDPPTDKSDRTETDIVNTLGSKDLCLTNMLVMKLLSTQGTQPLGDFEVQYAHDPISVKAAEQFRADLKDVGNTIDEANKRRMRKYTYLHPTVIPNAISI